MEEEKTKVSPTESYLLKRVKQLEKENKELLAALVKEKERNGVITKNFDDLTTKTLNLVNVVNALYDEFELQTEESETFNYLRFDGSFFKTLYKDNKRNSSGEQHLINFLNYVKENL